MRKLTKLREINVSHSDENALKFSDKHRIKSCYRKSPVEKFNEY